MKMIVTEKFRYAVDGYKITDFEPSDEVQEVPADAAKYGKDIGAAEEVDDEGKSVASSPEDKSRKSKGKGK